MLNSAQQAVVNTLLTRFVVPEQIRRGAQETEVVQGQYDGNAPFATRTVDGRRDHDKCVVNVDNVGLFGGKKRVEFRARIAGPNRAFCEINLTQDIELADFVVGPMVDDYAVSGELQHSPLLIEDDIFAAPVLMGVMYKQDFHW